MTVAVTTLRSTIATALSNPTVWQVFSFPPASPLANSVVVEPDDPMITPSNNSKNTISPMYHCRIKLYLPLLDNQGSLQDLEKMIPSLKKDAQIYVHCAGGYRSMIAASMLKSAGFGLVKNVYGGWSKIKELDLPKVMPAKQSV